MGDALVRAFHKKGINVIATARDVTKIDSSLASSSGVEVVALDVNDQSSIEAAVQQGTLGTNPAVANP